MRTLTALAACALLTGPALAGSSEDFEAAREARATMAAVAVCQTAVSEEEKRALYGKLLKYYTTPSMVTHVINDEVEALLKLSASDRTAMCLALGDQIKAH